MTNQTTQPDSLAALRQAMEWQPIETAPRDGREILIFYPEYRVKGVGDKRHLTDHVRVESGVVIGGRIAIAYYYSSEEGSRHISGDGYWQTLSGQNLGALAETAPTHWMPLPAPPTPKERDDEKR